MTTPKKLITELLSASKLHHHPNFLWMLLFTEVLLFLMARKWVTKLKVFRHPSNQSNKRSSTFFWFLVTIHSLEALSSFEALTEFLSFFLLLSGVGGVSGIIGASFFGNNSGRRRCNVEAKESWRPSHLQINQYSPINVKPKRDDGKSNVSFRASFLFLLISLYVGS